MDLFHHFPPEFFKTLVEHIADGVYVVDQERRIIYWNPAAERLTGFTAAEIVGHRCGDNRLIHCDSKGAVLCDKACPLAATLTSGTVKNCEVFVRRRDGSRAPVVITATAIRNAEGQVVGAVEIFRDNRAKLNAIAEATNASRLAEIDPLTGISNRRFAERKLGTYLSRPYAEDFPGALLLLDVDLFKSVNDRYGHVAGDEVLKTVARTLESCTRDGDMVCRWGGEEFLVYLPSANLSIGTEVAERLRVMVARSAAVVDNRYIPVTCSIGGTLVLWDDHLRNIVQRADQQLYAAKHHGRDQVRFDAHTAETGTCGHHTKNFEGIQQTA